MNENKPSIIIIGGGISGLSAGIHARLEGYETTIIEKNNVYGGCCLGYYRDGNFIDPCIHWLTGTLKGDAFYDLWKRLGGLTDKTKIFQLDTFANYEYNGRVYSLFYDKEKTRAQWLKYSPKDEKNINLFFTHLDKINSLYLPNSGPTSTANFKQLVEIIGKNVPNAWAVIQTMMISREKYAKRFKDKGIQNLIKYAQEGINNMLFLFFSYGKFVTGNGALPSGGSLRLVNNIVARYDALKGKKINNTSVKKVIIKDNKAIGVILDNGEELYADYIISCIDAHYTFQHLLENKYTDKSFANNFKDQKKFPLPSCFHITLNVDEKLVKDLPNPLTFEIFPLNIGVTTFDTMTIRNYSYDKKTFSNNGKTRITILFDQFDKDYTYWDQLYKYSKDEYQKQKAYIVDLVISRLLRKYPEFRKSIEILDIFTPVTFHRINNSYHGAYQSFTFTSSFFMSDGIVKNLKNFYLGSQWIQVPGGLPIAAYSGMCAFQRIDADFKKHIK